MIREQWRQWRGASSAILLGTMVGACHTPVSYNEVVLSRSATHYIATVKLPELVGKCFAPNKHRFNGALQIFGMEGEKNIVNVAHVHPGAVEELDGILQSLPRAMVTSQGVRFLIGKGSVIVSDSYFQFVTFPCDAPRRSGKGVNGIDIVSVAVDLPAYQPPARR